MKKWLWTAIGAAAILVSALFLRTYKLDLIPVFVDEAIYIRWAQVMRAEPTLRFLPHSDGKQPLFMWAVMVVLKFISDPLVAGRMVSILTGMGTLVGVFTLSFILFKSRKVSLLSSLLYALSPFAVFFDRMSLVDSMLSFFGVWSLVFAILTVKKLRLDFSFITGFFLGGAMLTKSPSLFFLLLLPTLLLFTPRKRKRAMILAIGLLLVSAVLGFGIYNILRLGPNFHMIGARNLDYVYPLDHILTSPLDPFLPFVNRSFEWLISMGPSSVLILAVLSVCFNFLKFKKEVFILALWVFFPILVQSEFAKVFTARYIFFVLPPLFVLAGATLKKLNSPPKRYVVYGLTVFSIIQSFLFLAPFFHNPARAQWPEKEAYFAEWTSGLGIKEFSGIIREKRDANPHKKIIVGTEGYFGTLPDGLQIYLEKEENITVIGVGLNLLKVPESLIESAQAGNITYLVANSSRLKFIGSFEENGLRVVSSIKKSPRKEGTLEFVNMGEVDTFYLLEVTREALNKI